MMLPVMHLILDHPRDRHHTAPQHSPLIYRMPRGKVMDVSPYSVLRTVPDTALSLVE